jgi:hypothetical protein
MSPRLATIASRQRRTRIADAIFAACVGLSTYVHFTSISLAVAASVR